MLSYCNYIPLFHLQIPHSRYPHSSSPQSCIYLPAEEEQERVKPPNIDRTGWALTQHISFFCLFCSDIFIDARMSFDAGVYSNKANMLSPTDFFLDRIDRIYRINY
jgi:hypothetical protein